MRIAIGQPSSEPKVDQLESKLFTGVDKHHVLRLEVEVDDVRVVDKDQRLHNFHHKPGHSYERAGERHKGFSFHFIPFYLLKIKSFLAYGEEEDENILKQTSCTSPQSGRTLTSPLWKRAPLPDVKG